MPPTRILKFTLAALAIVLVAGAIAFYLLVRSPWVEGAVARQLSARLGEPVTLGGLASGYAPLPWLEVTDLAIGMPAANGPPLMTLARARIELPWATIARNVNRLERIELEGLALDLAIAADGSDNFSALIERLSASEDTPAVDWSIGAATLTDSTVRYSDAGEDLRLALDGIGIEASTLAPRQPFPLALRVAARQGETVLHLNIDGDATLDTDLGSYRLQDARLKGWVGSPELGLGGLDWTATIETLQADMPASLLGIDGLAFGIAGLAVTGAVQVHDLDAGPRADFELATDPFSPRDLARTLERPLPDTADPAVLERAQARLAGSAGAAGLRIESLEASIDDSEVGGSVVLPAEGPPRLSLEIDQLDLDRYLPPAALPAPDTPAATIESLLSQLGELDLDAEVTIRDARASGASIRNLRIVIEPDATAGEGAQ